MIAKLFFNLFSCYAQRFLAAQNQGFLGFIGMAKEVSWGAAIAATDYLEFLSENVNVSIDRFPTRNAFAAFSEPDDYPGVSRVQGSFVTFANPISVGHLLKAAMNTVSASAVLSGFLHLTRFISVKSEFADGVPSQPYTLEIHRDVSSSHQYTGMICNKLTLHCAPNQDLRCTVDWIGKGTNLIAPTTPTFPGSPTKPFAFDTASVSLAGAANVRVEMFQVDINNNLEGIPALNASTTIARVRRKSVQEIRVRGTLDFVDVTEYQDFINQTERAFSVNMTVANSFNMYIQVPRMVYTAFPVGIAGRGRITATFDGIARSLTTSGVALDIGLSTVKSNY